MNSAQLANWLHRFCERTGCEVHERTPSHLTVRLAAEVDRLLTNRPYYWLFVERMGIVPETLKMKWQFAVQASTDKQTVPSQPLHTGPRIPEFACYFGSRGLQQIFQASHERGRFVRLFERPLATNVRNRGSQTYHTWACFNVKLEYVCEFKCEQLLSIGVQLQNGRVVHDFHQALLSQSDLATRLQPQLPEQTHLAREHLRIEDAWRLVLKEVELILHAQDLQWVDEAHTRLREEHDRHEAFVAQLPEDARAQHPYETRVAEINRQFSPRIRIAMISGGLFHLSPASNISPAV
jgi:hypothetical protein